MMLLTSSVSRVSVVLCDEDTQRRCSSFNVWFFYKIRTVIVSASGGLRAPFSARWSSDTDPGVTQFKPKYWLHYW